MPSTDFSLREGEKSLESTGVSDMRSDYDGKIVAKLRYGEHDTDITIPVRLIQDTSRVERSTAPVQTPPTFEASRVGLEDKESQVST